MKTIISIIILFFSIQFNAQNSSFINEKGKTIKTRFLLPNGFERRNDNETSFGYYLKNLPLKSSGSLVKYYNGNEKPANNVYDAVINLSIGNKDLHQCADAVMRLRADYLYSQKRFSEIHFNFTNGFKVDFEKWRKGNRIAIKGNKTSWKFSAKPSDSYETYWSYLEMIFNYAGTASLEKELNPIIISDLEIGDVFIKGGFPGHAIIVVDVAINSKNNKKIFLLAQSYMPAQELQVLKNPNDSSISPWYEVTSDTSLETPEWSFKTSQLKRF